MIVLEGLQSEDVVDGLRALGEPTRLRIAALVVESELSVSELCRILGQSQPRVSRHLKLLCDAGVLQRHSEGTSAYFGPSSVPNGRLLLNSVVGLIDGDDPVVAADRARLHDVWAERSRRAEDFFDELADSWESMRSRHVADNAVESLLEDLVVEHRGPQVDGEGSGLLLDIGTGTGRILELLADRFERCIGIDLSANMLHAARGKLSGSDVANWQVRQGNVYALDIGDNKADVAVLHHVLHFLDDPSAALQQVSFALDTDGLVIVADFSPHTVNELRTEFGHRWLGFSTAKVADWFAAADLELVETHELVVDQELPVETLTVTIWVARKTQ